VKLVFERADLQSRLAAAVAYALEEDGHIPPPQLGIDVASELAHSARQQSKDGHIGGRQFRTHMTVILCSLNEFRKFRLKPHSGGVHPDAAVGLTEGDLAHPPVGSRYLTHLLDEPHEPLP
jgi:hypothetical protein